MQGKRQPKHSLKLDYKGSGMAGPCLWPDLTAKESLLPPESRMHPEMSEEVGDGVSWGAAHAGSSSSPA